MQEKIVYRFETPVYPGDILYINLIEKYSCINDCLFCFRPRTKEDVGKPNIYEKKAGSFLYLEKSPSIEELQKAIKKELKENDKEIAIIGLGEPLLYANKVIALVNWIKSNYNLKVRIDTNGVCDKNIVSKLENAGLDEIRISLNAIDEKSYNQLCRPKVTNGFNLHIEFVKACVNSNINTYVSFVIGFRLSKTKEEYLEFAKSLGIEDNKVIFREFVS